MKPLKTIHVVDDDLQRVQNNVDLFSRQLLRNPLLDSVLIEDIAITAGTDKFVEHTLNRPFRGYLVAKKSAAATVFVSPTTNAFPSKFILLDADADVTVSLIVF